MIVLLTVMILLVPKELYFLGYFFGSIFSMIFFLIYIIFLDKMFQGNKSPKSVEKVQVEKETQTETKNVKKLKSVKPEMIIGAQDNINVNKS